MYLDISNNKGRRRLYDIIFFSFIATFMASIENMFPRPLPYCRIGLAFIILLLVIDRFSLKELIILIVIKNATVAIIFAYIFTAPFYLGLSGGVASIIAMKMLSKTKLLSSFGLSLIGSLVNNIVQLLVAKRIFLLPDIGILMQVVMTFSIISGSIVGIFAIVLSDDVGTIKDKHQEHL